MTKKFLDAGKSAQYEEFFMKETGGRRHVRLGATSTIDEIIMGRDMDFSGTDPHTEFMSKYGGHAGLKSGEKFDKGRRRGDAMASTMDSVIWGRDFDKSGVDPHEKFLEKHRDHAGISSVERGWRPAKRAGYSMASTMDSVIWGRDFDQSGDDPGDLFAKVYNGHAGGASGHAVERPTRKIIVGNSASMDEILTGRDMDGSEDAHAAFMEAHDSHAGVRSGPKPDRPFRKPGMSLKSCADNVIWGRDLDQSGDDFHQIRFEATFGSSAGALTGRLPKSARRAQDKDRMTKSTPNLVLKPSQLQERQEHPSSQQSGNFSYQPPARGKPDGCLTAREMPKPRNRTGSMGSLTSRDYGVHFIDMRGPTDQVTQQSPGVPTEQALAAAHYSTPSPTKARGTRSQCSTASSSNASKPRWR